MFFLVLQRLAIEFILDILYFPVWWYTGGIIYVLGACGNFLSAANGLLAPGLWLKNIFVPMFGQYDLQGRLVSFFMRLMNVLFRSIGMFMWFLIVAVLLLLWIFVPLLVGYMLIVSWAGI